MSLSPVPSSHESSPCPSPDPELEDKEEEEEEEEETAPICEEQMCKICGERFNQPCVLCCLHVFCKPCLEKQQETEESNAVESSPRPPVNIIVCTTCKQETKLSSKGLDSVQADLVMMNILDMSAIEEMQIVCQSCKAKEKAVARCSDCASFLCPNCVTAHQYMRCFENHKVVSFEELKGDGLSIHKPIFCESHSSESITFFCNNCQLASCSECLSSGQHKGHHCDRIEDIETKQLDEIRCLISESKTKIPVCEEASAGLQNALSDLQQQRDDARSLITETFQSYKAVLEKRQDALLRELDEKHSEKELQIMEQHHGIEQTIERIEDGCVFTQRVLENGNIAEVLTMKRLIAAQLLSLINNTPIPDVSVKIEFESDMDKFEEAVAQTFGCFKIQEEPRKPVQPETPLHSSFEMEGINLSPMSGGHGSVDTSSLLPPVSAVSGAEYIPQVALQSLGPLSIPNLTSSIASMVSLPSPITGVPGVSPQTINSIATSMQNLPTERSSSRNSYSPAMSDSGISVDAGSTGSGSNPPLINLQALAKLGTISVNGQGQITLNGQVIPGLNVNNVTGLPTASTSRGATPTNTATETSLAGLIPPTTRAQTPSLSDISSMLSPNPSLNGIGSLLSSSSGSSNLLPPTPTGIPIHGCNGNMNIPNISCPPPLTPSAFPTSPHPAFPVRGSGKMSAMQIRCKFGQLGPGKSQFNSPHGFCLGMEEDIVVADTNNHRIQVFEKTGEFKYQFGIPGREEGQLWYPRKVAVMRHSGKYVVCDRGNERSRMQIFTKNGHFIKKIAIRYIDIVAGLAITQQGHIVAVDSVSPTVFCIAESGDLVTWFDCSDYMREPSDIAISGKEYFVCDFKGHCVVVFNEDGKFMRRIGCENITNFPNGIDISDAGDVLVGDSHGNRFHVAVFQRDGSLIGEFECPYVKVSRCCGLKITSEGYVVTLAKNNHHVLVLNTLYIT